ncbi:hypothetical protein SETIT_9G083500v2 [Setaria italica]|uniref:Cytochrome P450 n=1 Tax=Setaria italica TaxID=4555 RepID=A0A368SEC3_SETIT|nr:hypothetical protein SETIT_9G083500v2 [Setaria italica]
MEPAYVAILSIIFLFSLYRLRGGRPRQQDQWQDQEQAAAGSHLALPPSRSRECFTEHDVTFANRPRFPSLLLISYDGTTLPTCGYGPHWRNLRRVATVQLLSAHRVRCMSPVISGEVRTMVRRTYRTAAAAPGGAARVELKRRLFEVSLSALMGTIARTKASSAEADADTDTSPEAQEFKKALDEFIPLVDAASVWDLLPVLRWFDVFGARKKIVAAVGRRDAFLRRLIDAERRSLDGGGENDKKSMISVLLSLQKSGAGCSMFTAGTETTAEWAMSLLLNHPEALKKAQAEIDACVGAEQCIVSETLRQYPVVPTLIPHESTADCAVGGHLVPAGTMLLVNVYAIHRDPAAWADPAAFRPERFEGGGAEGRLLMPFGMGRRKCPGETLALRTLGLVLGTLIQCFDWDTVGGAEVDMAEGVGITLPRAVPLEAMCRPRQAMLDVLQKL